MSNTSDNLEVHFLLYTLQLTGMLTNEQIAILKSGVKLAVTGTSATNQHELEADLRCPSSARQVSRQ
jgi:hypothetical protein